MPDWKGEVAQRLEGLRLDPAREAVLVEELSQHLEDRNTELIGTGNNESDACGIRLRSALPQGCQGIHAAGLGASTQKSRPESARQPSQGPSFSTGPALRRKNLPRLTYTPLQLSTFLERGFQ